MQSIGNQTIDIKDRIERPASGRSFNFNVPAIGGIGITAGTPGSAAIPAPQTIDEALDIVRYVGRKHKGRVIVVLDEMERIESKSERDLFAEFIKNISTLDVDIRFIFCGIASDIDELLNSHPSAGRILETIKLERLHHDYLWQIITTVSDKLGIAINSDMRAGSACLNSFL